MDECELPDRLTDELLEDLGIQDIAKSRRLLNGLSGQGVTDDIVQELLPSLFAALKESPDPDRALNNFVKWTDSVTSRYTHFQYLLHHPAALKIFFNVCGVSQLFSDILVRNPEYFEILANPGVRGGAKTAAALYQELSAFVDCIVRPELKMEAMRRFKQREMLRIGARDILGLADMPTTAFEFTSLADACVQKCCEVALAQLKERYGVDCPVPFCVVGMGKLGGRELNYSSDIDLVFVAGDDDLRDSEVPSCKISALEYAHKIAEQVVKMLSQNLANGHLFRVDVRLRPEGRFGALVRTLSSYGTYYESWAEPWERQALIKARAVAGDPGLGEAFNALVIPFVYRRSVTSDFVEAIRHNKRRIEKKAELEGQSHTNVKIGYGGIRDIEFTVQLMQLRLGGRDPMLRTTNTLEALARLRQSREISDLQASELAEDYRFLRTVEHRLQILYELQTQSLPTSPGERRLLARRLGFADAGAFDEEYRWRTERVRTHFVDLFIAGTERSDRIDIWRDMLEHVEMPAAQSAILQKLLESGFKDPESAYARLKEASWGGDYGMIDPTSRRLFRDTAASIIAACLKTGDPDASLAGLELLAQSVPNRAQLYRTLSEEEGILNRFAMLSSGSPALMQLLARRLEWLDVLVSEEIIDPSTKTWEAALNELVERGVVADGYSSPVLNLGAFYNALAAYISRERLRIGARDVWSEVSASIVVRELTVLAEVVLEALLRRFVSETLGKYPDDQAKTALESAAVIGLGKLGGRELGYGSDWDILLVYGDSLEANIASDGQRSVADAAMNALAEMMLSAGQELRTRGAPVEIDARLRPEGRFGQLARTVRQYRDYYLHSAQTWERQSLVKARPVAGNIAVARAYMRAVHESIYGNPLSPEATEEIRHMKRRIESERLKIAEREANLKLGNGGLSDIEFVAQLWQMKVGYRIPRVRLSGTVDALYALGGANVIPGPDTVRLADTYSAWSALRNRLALLGPGGDTLPTDERKLRNLAIGLGLTDSGEKTAQTLLVEQVSLRMKETRSIVERLFYESG